MRYPSLVFEKFEDYGDAGYGYAAPRKLAFYDLKNRNRISGTKEAAF